MSLLSYQSGLRRIGALIGLLVAIVCLPVSADERTPLLMEGKTSLYQRILTRPGAILYAHPSERSAGQPVPPLSIFFVYDRSRHEGVEWLEVGTASMGPTNGWLRSDKAIAWKQTLTVAFTNPAGREPTLFFRDYEELVQLIESENMIRDVDGFRAQITAGDIPSDFPVIAIEPETYVDPANNFYLLPILDYDEVLFDSGFYSRLLNVAAVTLQEGEEGEEDLLEEGRIGPSLGDSTHLLSGYRTGIVFVIDSTSSMGPYIDRTREAVRRIYRQLQDSEWGNLLSFGLVAYRDSIEAVPGLEYVTRVFADLDDGLDESTFFAKVNQVEPAGISSKGFNEDTFAGILEAIKGIDWSSYAGRFIVLITDAGAREATDPLSRTRLGADRLRLLAQEVDGGGIAIYALHLLTGEGRHTHEKATLQYQTLTRWQDTGPLYFGVQAGSLTAFSAAVDELASLVVQQIADASQGKLVEIPAADETSELARKTALVGQAMQLAYLGRATGTKAPRLINAWVAERDFARQSQNTLEVRVLITKNQLSDLQQTLEAILEAGELRRIDPENFFSQLRSAAARLARDPENVNEVDVKRLADVGLVGEWLEDLPYKSKIMHITDDDWLSYSYSEQQELLDEIEEKIILYQRFHDDTDRWMDAGRVKGDAVTSIPVDALP